MGDSLFDPIVLCPWLRGQPHFTERITNQTFVVIAHKVHIVIVIERAY